MNSKQPFCEVVTEKIGDIIIASDVRPATVVEINNAEMLHKEGKCPHNIVYDERGWMYDFRYCFTCGRGLGVI